MGGFFQTLNSNFSTSRHDREKMNADFERALKIALKNGHNYFWEKNFGGKKCLLNDFEDFFQCSFEF